MKTIFNFTFLLIFSLSFGQDLPRNPKPGKCYERCFSYDAKFEWAEIDCASIKQGVPNLNIKGEEAVAYIRKRIKFEKYQEKLMGLGYDLQVTGRIDERTIEAHHQYLKDKEKAAKKELKRLKKVKKDSLKAVKRQRNKG